MDLKNLIAYWHSSLCDAELMGIEMGGSASIQVPTTDIEQGKLDPKITHSLLRQQAEAENSEADINSEQSVNIVIAPLIVRQTYHHGYTKGSKSKTIWPLLIPAVLQKDGTILPDRDGLLPWIPRTLLEPTSAELVFGEIQTFDEFLTNNALFLNEDPQHAWHQFLAYGWKMLRFVTKEQGQELIQEAGYTEIEGQSVVINASNVRGIANNILKVYDRLLRLETPPPLLYSYANVKPQPSSSPLSPQQWSRSAQRHLGSVNNQFPLSPSQREAFYNFLALPSYTTLAVSGPPGTGKTTLLHSVIASLWTEAAIEGKNPPVIVATSTNNQAVTNVIDSLGQIDDVERWLPINSFGLYLVNNRERQATADVEGKLWMNKMGDGFPTKVETLAFVSEARKQYLSHCTTFFNQEVETVSDGVILLHEKLNKTAQWMKDGIIIAYKLFATKAQWAQLNVQDGHGSESYAAKLERQLNEAQAQYERYQEIHQQWMRHQIDEPMRYSLFPFVSIIQRNRRLRNTLFLNEFIPNSDVEPEKNLITEWIEKQLRQAKAELEKMQEVTTPAQIEKRLAQLENAWQTWCYQSDVSTLNIDQLFTLEAADGETESRCLLNWLDTQSRYDLFTLATHYWEGRWLLEVEALGLTQPDFRERQNRETQESRWRRCAFLTPCFVTTMHTGSSFFDYYQGQPEPLFDFIDLLIVDEAGQVPPEVSGAMFALAKQALVVGDTLQIEPVWNIPDAVDRGNLESHGLISNNEDFFQIKEKGLTASSGSVMKMAQEASPYQQLNAAGIIAERGMFLAEHRRCVPEIIGYCNDLAYGGRLRPKRPSIPNHPWPHMGYVHVKGESQSAGGSRQNQREATAVTAWITDNRSSLEKHYQTDIDNIIGIITPFAAQKRLLVDGLAAQGIVVSKVGTVHALQGAERPVVIFSSVYSAHDTGPYFFDRGPNMLNVAVSRAKDNFIVIGDMDIFDPDLNTPSGLLARYLFAEESNELVDAPLPPRPDSQTTKKTDRVRTLDKHRAVLARAFVRAKNRVVIVSPYLRWRAVSADDIGNKVAQAHARGVEVVIYVDDSFNENLLFPSAAKAAETLRQNGATVHICHNIHSKIICIDTDVFVEGSFNWLSAERTIQKFTRYETSTIHLGESARLYIEETLHDIQERLKT